MRKTILAFAAWTVLLTAGAHAQVPGQLREEQARQEARENYALGQSYMRTEDWDKAEAAFKRAIQLDPLFTLAHYSLGQVYMNTRTYPSAVEAFQRCKDAFKQLVSLASTDRAAADRRLDEAIRDTRDAIQMYQENRPKSSPQNQAREGSLHLEARLEFLERQKNRGASAPIEMPAEFSLALGSAYLRNGQLPQAEQEYVEAVKVNPRMGEAYNNLAVVYMNTGRLNEAENAVKQAEKAGYKVHPQLKKDIAARKS
jgi:Tfp pilus assembly protein PilF